jgi:hypothetical protein
MNSGFGKTKSTSFWTAKAAGTAVVENPVRKNPTTTLAIMLITKEITWMLVSHLN